MGPHATRAFSIEPGKFPRRRLYNTASRRVEISHAESSLIALARHDGQLPPHHEHRARNDAAMSAQADARLQR